MTKVVATKNIAMARTDRMSHLVIWIIDSVIRVSPFFSFHYFLLCHVLEGTNSFQ